VKAQTGGRYDRADLAQDEQTLLASGSFEHVTANVAPMDEPARESPPAARGARTQGDRTMRLTFVVEEKIFITSIEFQGNRKLTNSALVRATDLRVPSPLDEAKLRDDREKILAQYRRKGLPGTTARYEVARDTQTMAAAVTWHITESSPARSDERRIEEIRDPDSSRGEDPYSE
jgi:outer membrane protein assembly factor BamA